MLFYEKWLEWGIFVDTVKHNLETENLQIRSGDSQPEYELEKNVHSLLSIKDRKLVFINKNWVIYGHLSGLLSRFIGMHVLSQNQLIYTLFSLQVVSTFSIL